MMTRFRFPHAIALALLTTFAATASADDAAPAEEPSSARDTAAAPDPATIAKQIDEIIGRGLTEANVDITARTSDADFLRRVTLDVTGQLPTPEDVLAFEANDDPNKRSELVNRLVESDGYARNWARYWRDVIFSRATNQRARFSQAQFERWITEQFRENRPWDEIATELLTATGDVRSEGRIALMYAHDGDASEIAAETSRIFLGTQLSCANCHDHPYDPWKREQFHQLAAYFARVRVRPVFEEGNIRSFAVVSTDDGSGFAGAMTYGLMQQYDKNRDRKLSQDEIKGSRVERMVSRVMDQIDANGDKMLSGKELDSLQELQQQRSMMSSRFRQQVEHRMPDLDNPSRPGTTVNPVFFVSTEPAARGMSDADRRLVLAQQITEAQNPWFARAYVNRIWAEFVGEGFYMPIDDMGPSREARFPEALAALCDGFVASGHDPRWLVRTIALTETYQRGIRTPKADQPLPFASVLPARLSGDQVYDSLVQALGVSDLGNGFGGGRSMMMMRRGGFGGARGQFTQLFEFDPSTPKEDILGDVPQTLFLMNSSFVNNAIRTNAPTRLGTLLYRHQDDAKAIEQVYLICLARRPTERELEITLDHVRSGDHRGEAYEDLMWSLLNSTEFLSKR